MDNMRVVHGPTLDHCRVALIDDHALFLSGLSSLVSAMGTDIEIATFSESVSFVTALQGGAVFDVVISDLTMRKMNGLALMDEVRTYLAKTPVIIVSGVDSAIVEADVLSSGADAFLHKSCDHNDLKSAMLRAIAERTHASPQTKWSEQVPLSDRMAELSDRQTEVLQLIGAGASNKEISDALNISENTVKSHLKSIFVILGVNRRTACAQKARALGLI